MFSKKHVFYRAASGHKIKKCYKIYLEIQENHKIALSLIKSHKVITIQLTHIIYFGL